MKGKLKFTKDMLYKLYWKDGLSLNEIAKKFNCNNVSVLYWMKKFEIKRRSAYFKKVHIPKEVLKKLYWDKNLSSIKIAKRFNVNDRTIRKKLKKFGIKTRPLSESLTKKFKAPFSRNLEERAYFLGLRAGDFYVKEIRKCVRIQTTTTHKAQIDLLKDSFKNYGEIRKYLSKSVKRSDEWFIYVDLHSSFNFLLNKPESISKQILENDNCFYNFLTAYMDCEGSWKVLENHKNSVRFIFKIRTGDMKILQQIKRRLEKENLYPRLYLDKRKGTITPYGRYNKDIYDLTLYQKEDLIFLIKRLLPLSRHSEKIRKMNFILKNKNKNWNEIEHEWKNLRKEIERELLKNLNLQE
ncbi:MAG: hypothetical protein KAT37_04190 [Candidatus Aenigmarchaeota archaeon]|nr:hypothetical protein [Candidatus Aenigmarchaeota archaeon]